MPKTTGSFVLEIKEENQLEGQYLEKRNSRPCRETSKKKEKKGSHPFEGVYCTEWDEPTGNICKGLLYIKQEVDIFELIWHSKCANYKGIAMLYKENLLIGYYEETDILQSI